MAALQLKCRQEPPHGGGTEDAPPIFFSRHRKENAPCTVEKKRCFPPKIRCNRIFTRGGGWPWRFVGYRSKYKSRFPQNKKKRAKTGIDQRQTTLRVSYLHPVSCCWTAPDSSFAQSIPIGTGSPQTPRGARDPQKALRPFCGTPQHLFRQVLFPCLEKAFAPGAGAPNPRGPSGPLFSYYLCLSEFKMNNKYLFSRYIYLPWVMYMRTEILKYERIRNMRTDRGLNQEDVAEVIHVKQNTYSQYEIGVLNYPLDVVVQLAEYYNVSIDYLVGLTDEQTPYPRKRKKQ